MITDGDPLPAPAHLYTWVDIDAHFASLASHGQWPEWLLEVDAFWDGVDFTVRADITPEVVWQWLTERLGPLTIDPVRQVVLLESTSGEGHPLDVRLRSGEEWTEQQRRPQWNERRVVRDLAEALPAPALASFPHGVRMCAFHSFKGGVGRTLHALALALELADRARKEPSGGRVLLVDADLEAPGISWMIASAGNRLDFALDDFVALLHGSTDDGGEAIGLARKFLLNQERDGIVVMPTTRDPFWLAPPRIEPVDLLTHDRPPYLLTERLAELAHAVGADTVVIDLRAGTSELSAPILLDPRVHRVFVTTISDQSVQGTTHLLDAVAHRAPSRRSTDPACAVLITQFQEKEHGTRFAEATQVLVDAVAGTVDRSTAEPDTDTVTDQEVTAEPIVSPFQSPLLALPGGWNEVRERIEQTGLCSAVESLAEALRPTAREALPQQGAVTDPAPARRSLTTTARGLVFAETADQHDDFLPTDALVELASAHRTEAPVEVIVGAKGAGKTFTYLRMCQAGRWDRFGMRVGVSGAELRAPLVPVLASQNLSRSLEGGIIDVRQTSAIQLTGTEPPPFQAIRDLVTEALSQDLNEVSWRRIWLTCLGRAAGLDVSPETVEAQLTDLARRRQAVFVIDGLEDLFQEFSSDGRQQQSIRALLTGCPEWLRSLRGHPLGLIVFVRRDLVLNSIRQNAQQFLDRHRAYELRWNNTEALRLTAWVCGRAGVLADGGFARSATRNQLSQRLVGLWGRKLGTDDSREARSEEWFLAALSDFNLQIQPRDIVSFLAAAAENSAQEHSPVRWKDRLLTPTSMRRALAECSVDKIDAIKQENAPVRALFDHLSGLPDAARTVPFTLSSVDLDRDQARVLEANGVLYQENELYWIPEIYRYGLRFTHNQQGRPRMVSIIQLIRRRRGAP